MEFLQGYDSTDSESTDTENMTNKKVEVSAVPPSMPNLNARAVRQVYLITYSQADSERFPTRESFAQAIVRSFNSTNTNIVEHWVCCKEAHHTTGFHYHMAIKLQRCKRWLPSKKYLKAEYGISVHFSNLHYNYYSAWKYTTKKDSSFLESDNHPDLSDLKAPKTDTASSSRKKSSSESDNDSNSDPESASEDCQIASDDSRAFKGKKRKKRMSSFDLSEIIIRKGIKSRTELLAYANQQKSQGKYDIAEFILLTGVPVL